MYWSLVEVCLFCQRRNFSQALRKKQVANTFSWRRYSRPHASRIDGTFSAFSLDPPSPATSAWPRQQLMDIVFDQKFPVVGEELPVSLGFENIIFVMEDVDAASPIVRSRDRSKSKRGTKTTVKVQGGGGVNALRL